MPTWIGHIISAVIGALITGLGIYVALFGRVKDLEARQTVMERRFEEEKTRTDERIYRVQDAAAAVLAAVQKSIDQSAAIIQKVLEQNALLIGELRSSRRNHNE